MAKTKVSQWDSVAANNTDINSININEGCPPSTINNAIREVMAQIKDWQDGSSGDGWNSTGTITSAGTLNVTGSLQLDGAVGTSGQVLVSSGSAATPTWGDAFVTGMIMLWSGSIGSVPSGWRLCDGGAGTPNLMDRFIVGAGSTYAVNATGGSANATLVSHSHTLSGTAAASAVTGTAAASAVTGTTGAAGSHNHYVMSSNITSSNFTDNNQTFVWATAGGLGNSDYRGSQTSARANRALSSDVGNHTHSISGTAAASSISGTAAASSISGTAVATGSSATGANLPPYYALCYIMKL